MSKTLSFSWNMHGLGQTCHCNDVLTKLISTRPTFLLLSRKQNSTFDSIEARFSLLASRIMPRKTLLVHLVACSRLGMTESAALPRCLSIPTLSLLVYVYGLITCLSCSLMFTLPPCVTKSMLSSQNLWRLLKLSMVLG